MIHTMKILVFCAHADDEVIGLGGTIRKFADAGADIRLIHFSAGAEGYASPEEKETICTTRAAEVKKVCRILGISSYRNFNLLDWSITADNSTYRLVIEEIRSFQPDAVFTHLESDYRDHKNVSTAVAEGHFHASLACAMEAAPVWKNVPLYHFEVIKLMPEPELIVDISGTMSAKLEAMEVYASQTGVVGGADQMLESRAAMRGQSIGVRYGEALIRNRMRPRKITDLNTLLEM